jgi:hypothetical protein
MATKRASRGRQPTLPGVFPFDSCRKCKRDLTKLDSFVVRGDGVVFCIWCYDKYVVFVNNGGLRGPKDFLNGEETNNT